MSWESRNIAAKQGIHQRVSSISDLASQLAQLQEQRLNRLQSGFGNISTNLQRWGEGRAARKFEDTQRKEGELFQAQQGSLGREAQGTLEKERQRHDEALQQAQIDANNARSDKEIAEAQKRLETELEWRRKYELPSLEQRAREGRAQQTINTGDDQEQIATAWANFLAMNRDIHPEWLIVDEQTGRESIIPPSDAIERWRGAMYKKYGMEAVDEFLSLLGVGDGLGAGAGGDMGGDQGVVPEEPKGTTVKEILPDIIGEVPTNFGAAAGTTFGEAYRMFVEPVQRMLGLIPPKAPTPAKDVLPPLKEKYYHPH